MLFGSSNSQIATLVERQTRYVMLVKITGKDTETLVNTLKNSKTPANFALSDRRTRRQRRPLDILFTI